MLDFFIWPLDNKSLKYIFDGILFVEAVTEKREILPPPPAPGRVLIFT